MQSKMCFGVDTTTDVVVHTGVDPAEIQKTNVNTLGYPRRNDPGDPHSNRGGSQGARGRGQGRCTFLRCRTSSSEKVLRYATPSVLPR